MYDSTNLSWKRRAITVPSWFLLAIVTTLLAPVVIPLTALYDLVRRRDFLLTRTLLFFPMFFTIESGGLAGGFVLWAIRGLVLRDADSYRDANRRLQRWWSSNLFWGAVRLFSMRVDIEGLERLEEDIASIGLVRHASTMDTMLPLAVVRNTKRFRYVIKAELLADPAMDYIARRFENVFVRRGYENPAEEVERVVRLGDDLEHNGVVIIYPEGTRFTPEKRERLVKKLEAKEADPLLPVALRLSHTLPPLREGAVQLIAAHPEIDVLVIAHRGLERAGSMYDLWAGGLLRAHLEIQIWRIPAAEVPREREELEEWMVQQWERIDAFAARSKALAERGGAGDAASLPPRSPR